MRFYESVYLSCTVDSALLWLVLREYDGSDKASQRVAEQDRRNACV